jgi:hypothetical protein
VMKRIVENPPLAACHLRWLRLRRSGVPGTAGGRRCCRGPAPDPATCPWGTLWPGFPTACPGRSAFKGEFAMFSAGESSCREGRSGAAPGGRGREKAVSRKDRRPSESHGRQLAKQNCGVR